jgi:hypothetical protein
MVRPDLFNSFDKVVWHKSILFTFIQMSLYSHNYPWLWLVMLLIMICVNLVCSRQMALSRKIVTSDGKFSKATVAKSDLLDATNRLLSNLRAARNMTIDLQFVNDKFISFNLKSRPFLNGYLTKTRTLLM